MDFIHKHFEETNGIKTQTTLIAKFFKSLFQMPYNTNFSMQVC